jgi:hypothetical protein
MPTPTDILEATIERVSASPTQPIINSPTIINRVELVCRGKERSGACTRLLLACSLAKVDHPEIDIRKPYTDIGGTDAYSGRSYDERYISSFINKFELPCNSTTAFLTPAFRNKNEILTPETRLAARRGTQRLYQATLQLLTDVYTNKISAQELLGEVIRWLLIIRDENLQRLNTLQADLRSFREVTALSSEGIVKLVELHLACPGSSRLPVLIVAAAYEAAADQLRENIRPLQAHNAADKQTRSTGDIEITLVGDNNVVTAYEMKDKKVQKNDIDTALHKVSPYVDNYIFVTTEVISEEVREYAASMYKRTGGTEFVILDCIGFLRHFLHLFHRLRTQFLEAYQQRVLEDSAVSQILKEAFLTLRLAAESANSIDENDENIDEQPLLFPSN